MPEGDTIYKAAVRLRPALVGRAPKRVLLSGRLAPSLQKRVESVESRGKHLLIRFGDGEILRTHLGMHGSWRLFERADSGRPLRFRRAPSVELWFDEAVAVCFRAKELEFLSQRSLHQSAALSRLGPDVLSESFCAVDAARRARELLAENALIVDVLLDQRVVCGIGNVYKNEALFLEGVRPQVLLKDLSARQLESIFARCASLVRCNPWPRTAHDGRQ